MIEGNELVVGKSYEAAIGLDNLGKALYLGKVAMPETDILCRDSSHTVYSHVILYRNRKEPVYSRFDFYQISGDRLQIFNKGAEEYFKRDSERDFAEKRLRKAGIRKEKRKVNA